MRTAFLVTFVFYCAKLMELGYQVTAIVGDKDVEEHELQDEILADAAQEVIDAVSLKGRYAHGRQLCGQACQLEGCTGGHEVDFVEGDDHRATACSNLFQYLFDGLDLAVNGRIGSIDHVYEKICFGNFFQGGPKCSYQGSGQALDETYGIRQKDFLPSCETHTARHGIKSGKEPVLGKAVRAGKRIEQGRLTGVSVANQGHHGRSRMFASFAMQLTVGTYMLKFFLQLIFLAAQQAAVYLDLLLTFTALLHTTFLARQVRPLPGQARQIILDLRQFNLQASLFGMGALAKDDEDQRSPVKHLCF